MFSKYLFVYKTRIIRNFTYKFEVYGNILMQTIIMITTSFFWRALFQDKAFGNGITADSMMTYTIMSSVLSVLFITGVERRIQESVEKGTIAIDLMRPVNIFGMFLAEDLGSITALLIQNLLPILLLGSLLIKFPAIVSLSAIPLFAASVILSMAINWLLAAIFGMWAFTAISMDPLKKEKKHMRPEIIIMLTHHDVTVKNAAEIFEAYLTNHSVSGDDSVKQLYAFDGYGRLDTV